MGAFLGYRMQMALLKLYFRKDLTISFLTPCFLKAHHIGSRFACIFNNTANPFMKCSNLLRKIFKNKFVNKSILGLGLGRPWAGQSGFE
jgi:hypothetical protein